MKSTRRRAGLGALATLACALGCGLASAQDTTSPPPREDPMTDELGLTSDDYWKEPEVGMPVFRRLRDSDFLGLKIGAPSAITTDVHKTAPLLLYRAGTYRDLIELEYSEHALVTIVALDRNRLFVTYAANRDQRAPGTPQDPATAQEGYTATSELNDLFKDNNLPAQPGSYLVCAVMRDRVSNRLRVAVKRSAASYDDPEVKKLLRSERRKLQAPAVSPAPGVGAALPAYGETAGAPPLPELPGLALVGDPSSRAVILREGATCVLRGAFRVAAQPEELVKPGELPWLAKDAPRPTAVVRLHLLVVGADRPSPTILTLDLPSTDAVDPEAEAPVVTGQFAIDLLRLPKMPRAAKTYFVYAFCGEAMVGPIPVALVAEGSLHQPR